MNFSRIKYYILSIGLLVMGTPIVAHAEEAAESTSSLGLFTLLPPLIAIVLAFVTKDVILSLFIGAFSGAYIYTVATGSNILMGLVDAFLDLAQVMLDSLADPWNAGIILQVMAIGGLIAIVTKTGGANAIAKSLSKFARGPVSTQIITWLLGMLVFFDDYANALIVGPIMRPVSDEIGISRERLAFVIDATAAPVTGMALISTWIGYELSLISEAFEMIGVEVSTYSFFLNSLPFRFYNIFMLAFVVISSLTLREFGPMKKAQERARDKGLLVRKDSNVNTHDEEFDQPAEGSLWNAIIPIGLLIIFSFVGFYFNGRAELLENGSAEIVSLLQTSPLSFVAIRETFGASDASIVLFQAALASSIIAMIMGVVQKYFNMEDGIQTWFDGMNSLLSTCGVLILAWSLSSIMGQLGTAEYLVSLLDTVVSPTFLPALIFIFGSIIAFATGTSFGTMGILMPLAIPLAYGIDPSNTQLILASSSAVLAGAILGDHSSPISDTTIMSSMGAGSNLIDHVRTQTPYALFIGVITIVVGYIPAALGVSPWIINLVGILIILGILYLFGSKVDPTDNPEVTIQSVE